jgi:hypothetical protein
VSESKKEKRGARYDPKPTMDVASRRQFRKAAALNSALLLKAEEDEKNPYHSTAIHMMQEAALRTNPKLLKQALRNPKHALHKKALSTVKARNSRRKATLRAEKDNVAGSNALPFAS